MAKCVKCLRGAKISVTGVNPKNTLKLDMGGAVLYVMPREKGKIDVHLNSENLTDGEYAVALWDGERWTHSSEKK